MGWVVVAVETEEGNVRPRMGESGRAASSWVTGERITDILLSPLEITDILFAVPVDKTDIRLRPSVSSALADLEYE